MGGNPKPEEIAAKLRSAEIGFGKDKTKDQAVKALR